MNRPFRPSLWLAVITPCLVTGSSLHACNVPLFRYALEHWTPDGYRLTIVQPDAWGTSEEAAWRHRIDELASGANLEVDVAARSRLDGPRQDFMQAAGEPPLPLLLLEYPERLDHPRPIWSAELTDRNLQILVASPARDAVISRLVAGHTAVWLLVESGDAGRDDETERTLAGLLAGAARTLSLPPLSPTDPADQLRSRVPLRVEFSILRVPRTAAEEPFVRILLAGAGAAAAADAGPLVVPVFGRGRALCVFSAAAATTADNVEETCRFMVGACSCEVKELNPGFDVLLAAEWDRLLSIAPDAGAGSPPVTGTSAVPEYVAVPAGAGDTGRMPPAETASNPTIPLAVRLAIGVVAVVVAAVAARAAMRR